MPLKFFHSTVFSLLEPEGEESKSEDDEISQELKKIQAALIPVQECNTIQKEKLLSVAKAGMAKQEVKKKLQEHDAKASYLKK
ncbi:UNVERIFIED_CONTAM: hypothetical protein NCL1_48229 [Trichonephila clavipes]